jgi:hypothetical protein
VRKESDDPTSQHLQPQCFTLMNRRSSDASKWKPLPVSMATLPAITRGPFGRARASPCRCHSGQGAARPLVLNHLSLSEREESNDAAECNDVHVLPLLPACQSQLEPGESNDAANIFSFVVTLSFLSFFFLGKDSY